MHRLVQPGSQVHGHLSAGPMPVSSPLGRCAVCPLLYIHVYTGVYGESRNKHLMCLCVCICVYVAETEWKAIP